MNISGAAAVAALAGYQTGEAPLEALVALLKASQEQMESPATLLLQAIEAAGSAEANGGGLDSYG